MSADNSTISNIYLRLFPLVFRKCSTNGFKLR